MSCVSNFLKGISEVGFSTLLRDNTFSRSAYDKMLSVATTAMNHLSPKQSVRPDNFSETIKEVTSTLQTNFAFRLLEFYALFNEHIPSKAGADYLNALSVLETQSSAESPWISIKEKQILDALFSQAVEEENCLDIFDFFVASTQDPKLKKQHKVLKEIFIICGSPFFDDFKGKLQNLARIQNINEMDSLPEHEKLTVGDINILMGISSAKTLLTNLKSNWINGTEELCSRLIELAALSESPFFAELKRLSMESRSPGSIFLGDRHTFQTLLGQNFDYSWAMQQLFMGRICHVGVFVKPKGKDPQLSHVNRITKNHAVRPVHPLILPFSYSLTLDIKPLIPSHLPEKQQQELIDAFTTEFQRLAQEEHPELPLADFKTEQYLKMVIFGHKTISSQSLANVAYPPKGTPTMCSTYVGITFLKAVQKMNELLEEQGAVERIPHPFGEHEDLMNMDILRFFYLLTQLNVVHPTLMDETLAKVISSTSQLSLK